MPELKILSGNQIIKILVKFGFSVERQKGSHVKLKRTVDGSRQTLTIPRHQELDKGTIKAIYNQARQYVAEGELKKNFYT
jgi:predicted RNA binding protein YcfA (HicA-like mRNA interferase family)